MEEKKDEAMDEAEDLYVANDLYEEDDFETGISRGASPTRDGGEFIAFLATRGSSCTSCHSQTVAPAQLVL